jgi:hypothetical protein
MRLTILRYGTSLTARHRTYKSNRKAIRSRSPRKRRRAERAGPDATIAVDGQIDDTADSVAIRVIATRQGDGKIVFDQRFVLPMKHWMEVLIAQPRASFPPIVNPETWTRPGYISSGDEESKILDFSHRMGGNVGLLCIYMSTCGIYGRRGS